MKPTKEIALFIPCYNEEERLNVEVFLTFIRQESGNIDFYFIDDGSSDNTREIILQNFLDLANVKLISLPKNQGKGNAVREGVLETRGLSYNYYGFIDADLDIPLDQVSLLYRELIKSSCHLAVSKRDLKSNFKLFNLRSVASVVMVNMANKIIGYDLKLNDTQCGCKMLHADIVEICFGERFISEWLFDIEIFLRLKMRLENPRERISEVPISKLDKNGKSKFSFRQNLRIIPQLYKINKFYN